MTHKSEELAAGLAGALYENKALLITGGSGVGKTFLAKQAAHRLEEGKYRRHGALPGKVSTELISCHGSMSYGDIVGGIAVETAGGRAAFGYRDKLMLKMLKAAAYDYEKRIDNKYVLILDDVQNNDLPTLLGDAAEALGGAGEERHISLNGREKIKVPPNFYVVATYRISENSAVSFCRGLMGKFYVREISSDIEYITENRESENAFWYERVRGIVLHYSQEPQGLSVPGHGYFAGDRVCCRVRYQVVPLLKQYMAEGILAMEARDDTEALERASSEGTARYAQEAEKRITGIREGVTAGRFVSEEATSVPIENLIGRIVQQGLIPHEEIENNILFNSNICCREKTVSGITYRATVVAGRTEYEQFCRSGGDRRKYYNAGTIYIRGKKYHFTGGMQPKEFTNGIKGYKESIWNIRGPIRIGESTKPNVLLFGIVKHYYKTLIDDLALYTGRFPEDASKAALLRFAEEEWEAFLRDYKEIRPSQAPVFLAGKEAAGYEADANKKANLEVRKRIGKLVILWSDPGERITASDGTEIVIEGVGRIMDDARYREYGRAMEALGIRQMILQGPPGTSKTYTAKAFLKYAAGGCTDGELAGMQISDYDAAGAAGYCRHLCEGKGTPPIAWDIVQFHPSYGYEDFVRGIRVSTREESGTVVYETVNKVLGAMARLAAEYDSTKFYLIIDEINRANLATVFGELIYGLEYRDEAVATPYAVGSDYRLSLPDNLYIIGTMNTADKSIGGIDYAIRRRFLFFEQLPEEGVIRNYRMEGELSDGREELNRKACRLFEAVSGIFEGDYLAPEYRREDVQIGHTYFLAETEEQLRMRFAYQIIPILKEYYKDGIIVLEEELGDSGFGGLLRCIAGGISLSGEKEKVDKIFHDLTEE